MGTTIDERVVHMGFDNRQFESGVQTSLKSLDALKNGLKLDESARSLEHLSRVGREFTLAPVGAGLATAMGGFSALGVVGFSVLNNLTNSVMRLGQQMLNNLAIAPLKKGFQEYETQMNAIQTVLANTASKGTTLEDVNSALDQLNEYSDKTIYNFTEMTRNIGTFTAAGISLETSTQAIKGIANLAAVSGSNSQQASTAMYQLSQALASGTVKLMDWNSVVNAGMGGQVFQDALKETARVHKVNIDAMIKKEGSFRETLQNGWLTAEILTETLAKFTGDLSEEQLRSIGYTDEQIAGIMQLGKTASDAATKVKTFTQLKDTLAEAVQSGWSQTWRLVIGDFEEAKAFYTEVSDIFGGFISQSSDARNNLLQGWKDLGGRTVLLESLRQAFNGIVSIITPIKEAFSEIFPAMTAKNLYQMTFELWRFTKQITLAEDETAFLKRTFKGVAAAFDIVRLAISAVVEVIGRYTSGIRPAIANLFKFLAGIGDSIVAFREFAIQNDIFIVWIDSFIEKLRLAREGLVSFIAKMRKSFDEFIDSVAKNGFLATALASLKSFAGSLGKLFDSIDKIDTSSLNSTFASIVEGVKVFVKNVKEGFLAFSGISSDVFDSFVNRAKERFAPLAKLGNFLTPIFETMLKKFQEIRLAISSVTKAVGVFVGSLWKAIIDGLSKVDLSTVDFKGLFDSINVALLSGLILSINNFVNKGTNIFSSIVDVFKGVKGVADSGTSFVNGIKSVLDGVRGGLEAWQQSLRSDTLLKIAGAIAILTVSLIGLSMVDSVKLTVAIGAITTMFADLFGAMALFDKVAGKGAFASIPAISAAMVAMSASLLIMSIAVKQIAELDPNKMANGIAGITAMLVALVGSSIMLSKNAGDMIKGSLGIVAMSVSLMLLTSVVKKLGDIDPARLTNGLLGVGVLLSELALFMKVTDVNGLGIVKAAGILIMAGAINILAIAVGTFANMDSDKMSNGLMVVALVLTELAVFSKLTGTGQGIVTTAVGVTILSGALYILANVLEKMGSLAPDQILKGLAAMAGSLGVIALAMASMPPNMIVSGIGLAIIASSLLLLANSLTIMSKMTWEELAVGLVALGGALGIIAVAVTGMSGALGGAAALIVVAFALSMLVPAFQALAAMKIGEIGVGLLALAGTFAVLGLAGLILAPLVPVLLGLSAAMLLLGLGILAVGAGVLAFSAGMAALALSGAAGVASVALMVTTLVGLIPIVATAVAQGILTFVKLIGEGAPIVAESFKQTLLALISVVAEVTPALLAALTQLLLNLINTIVEVVPNFIDAVLFLLTSLIESIAANIPKFIKAGYDILLSFLKGIRDNIGKIVTVALEIVKNFIDGVASKLPAVMDSAFKLVIAFIEGLTKAIRENVPTLKAAVDDLAIAIIDGLTGGLATGMSKVTNSIAALGAAALAALKAILGIKSPSKETKEIGLYMTDGLVDGILKFSDRVSDASEVLGKQAMAGLSGAISHVSDLLVGEMDLSPTIRPVFDLSEVISGGRSIDNILANKTINASVSANKLATVSSNLANVKESQDDERSTNSNTEVNFVQNNYSPKALSRIDIYRQTKTQLSTLKTALQTG